jgi:hypothetical protein
VLMSTKGGRDAQKQGLHGIYCGEDVAEVHERSQEVGRLKTALGWRVHDGRRGRNCVMRSSVRGMTRSGRSCARGGTR